jgi:predicted GNAT family acetyltransferase
MNYDEKKLKVNDALQRLELETDGSIAFIEYKLVPDKLFLIHTEVPVALEGKGAASAIVQKALQYAKDNNYKIVPICSFVRRYLKKHKEWNDIVAPDAERFLNKL